MLVAKITVGLKQDVMDPQGNAVAQALHSLGHADVRQVRVGRSFELLLDSDDLAAAREDVRQMCEALLANTVIERYEIDVQPVAAKAQSAATAEVAPV